MGQKTVLGGYLSAVTGQLGSLLAISHCSGVWRTLKYDPLGPPTYLSRPPQGPQKWVNFTRVFPAKFVGFLGKLAKITHFGQF